MRRFGVRRNVLGYDGVLECDAVVWSATRHAASLQTPARANTTMRDITTGMGGIRQDARIWWTCGRGNLRENREDPAPTVGIAGRRLRSMPHRPSFMPMRASTGRRKGKSRRGVPRRYKDRRFSQVEARRPDNDAARRVATSSEKRENLVETAVFQKGSRRKKPAWVQSFMERAFHPCNEERFNQALAIIRRP